MRFQVNRQDFRDTQVDADPPADLGPGQVRLAIERFAVTTNNVSYAVAGDLLDYWGFFPADQPWGHIPVMGLGSVVESTTPGISTGGRYFGFYPMGTEVVINAEPRRNGIRDVGAHRSAHAKVYTDFRDVAADPTFRPEQADVYLLLWGMFSTSFLVDDYLADNDFKGASQTLITSASSKTSISLASCLARRADHRSIGLTSERNRSFVENLELYDQVITYDEIDQLDPGVTSTVVDMAGNATVRSTIHSHFGDNLTASITVGATHWEDQAATDPSAAGKALPGATPEFFFAPAQSAKRSEEWGADELARRTADAFLALLDSTDQWLNVEHRLGPDGVEATYRDLLEGQADPATGFVCAMGTDPLTDPT